MNIYKIGFTSKLYIDFNDDILESVWDYLGCLYKNGQILKNYELIEDENGLSALVTLPDDEALNAENNNIYVNKYLNAVNEHFYVSSELFGKNMNQDESCGCKEPSWYMLYTDWTLSESPVVCGDCGKTVPLFKLPHILSTDEHYGVLGWQGAYKNTDVLWTYCLSDRFTFRQMHDPKSQLSKDGIDICRAFEKNWASLSITTYSICTESIRCVPCVVPTGKFTAKRHLWTISVKNVDWSQMKHQNTE